MKGTQQFALFESFHKKLRFIKISTKNQFVEKFPQNIALFENFHTKCICGKISLKKSTCRKISATICFVGKFSLKNCFFLISTKFWFVGKLSQLALKLIGKTPNEVGVESIGSVLEKRMKPQRPGKQFFC